MSISGTASLREQNYPRSTQVAVEALGSFFVVFAGLATALFSASPASVAFAYGLALLAALVSFGHVSHGGFNPAFSLGLAVAGRLKWVSALLFMVAQTIGALLAAVVLYALVKVLPSEATGGVAKIFSSLANGYDSHSPSQVPLVGVLIVEFVAMVILVAVVLGATSARNKSVLGPVAIGVAYAVAITITLPISNGSLNPARATSVVFLADSWALGQLWLFWLTPLFAAALVGAIYRSFQTPVLVQDDDLAQTVIEDDAVTTEGAAEDSAAGLDEGGADSAALHAEAVAATEKANDAQDFFDRPIK